MFSRSLKFLTGALACSAVLVPVGASAQQGHVSVRVEGSTRTLLPRTLVTQGTHTVSKDGNDAHSCPGKSVAGALEDATGGSWTGSWSDGLGYFVSTIMKENHGGVPDFWSLWINNKVATTGVCQATVKPGDEVLFIVDRCVFDASKGECSNKPVLPMKLRLSPMADSGRGVVATVVAYNAKGKSRRVANASIIRNGTFIGKTDSRGRRRVRLRYGKTESFQALKRGYSRSEPVRALLGG